VKDLIRGRQTPAMVIAILALIAALTGAAVASPGATTSAALTKKKVKKIATNVANARIAALAPTLDVRSAGTATTANSLTMFAQVTATGGLTGNTRGFGSVSHPFTGIYCFTGLARTPTGGAATVDYNDSGNQFAQFGLGVGISGCPAGTQAFVGTFTGNAGFFVEMW
jgi:hypothetical protein